MPAWLRIGLVLGLFGGLVVVLALGLNRNPREVPSPLVGKPVPAFELPRLQSAESLASSQLLGTVTLLNVWATWCVACRQEHDALLAIAEDPGINLIGLNWKDDPSKARRWLQDLGDPYDAVAVDVDGRVGIDFGVYGAPETFVIDKAGVIRYKHIGPIDGGIWRDKILPVLAELE